MTAREVIAGWRWLLRREAGLNPRALARALRGLPRFVRDWRRFRRAGYAGRMAWRPCLGDWAAEAGVPGAYLLQDLLVARRIHAAAPQRHVDVGSRLDGFVAQVASFRDLEVFDIRPFSRRLPGVTFRQADLTRPLPDLAACCDSLSCLHALEHFGLGRYGDAVDPRGHERGLSALAAMLRPGGTLYLSVPIGAERVEFNAHRVFDPRTILALAAARGLTAQSLTAIRPGGESADVPLNGPGLAALARQPDALGVFVFRNAGGGGPSS